MQVNADSVVVVFGTDADQDDDGVEGPGGSNEDLDDSDPNVCRDSDGDGCDDCSLTGADGSGGDPLNDGPDADGDGVCDSGTTADPGAEPNPQGEPDPNPNGGNPGGSAQPEPGAAPDCGSGACGQSMLPMLPGMLLAWGAAKRRRPR